MNDLIYWIWLSLSCTPSTATFPKLIEKFGLAEAIYNADIDDISKCIGYKASDRSNLADKNLDKAENIYNFCTKHNVGMLSYVDERYPRALREISSPPVLLYYRGKLPDFNNGFFVAAVGTRSLSDYGRRTTFKIAYDLASAGATLVSGMAIGIDGVALAGALSADKSTVAVIGSGIDVCYPKQHLKLAREIVKNGCVITEYAPGTPPDKLNFPRRNRIISGLSAATLIMEGRERSGALITARCAKEQNRALYALPGNVGTEHSEVTNLLIKNGAKLFTAAEDVLNDFQEKYNKIINPFQLKTRIPVDIMSQLRYYEVAADCPGDKVFFPPISHKKSAHSVEEVKSSPTDIETPTVSVESIDKDALEIYKKIPFNEECDIEALATEQMPLRVVMKHLLKLEMMHFVTMLPGEKVARKFK